MSIYVPKNKTAKKKLLPIGDYDSIVTDAGEAKDYKKDSAIRIHYLLTNSAGEQFTYSEVFFLKPLTDRTVAFDKYLEKNGVANLGAFIGCHEKVVIRRDTKGPFRTIDEREFISGPTTNAVTE